MPQILYADKDVLVAVKPVGLLSEEASEGSLPALLAERYGKLFTVHRLDRVVGGVMVYARNSRAAAALSRAVTENKLVKRYTAVLEGAPDLGSFGHVFLIDFDTTRQRSRKLRITVIGE